MNTEIDLLIQFLIENRDKEVVFGHSLERSCELTSDKFEITGNYLFLNTYEGM